MWNYRVTSVWGIPIRVNISLLVFLPVLAWLLGSGEQIALYTAIINELTAASLDASVLRRGNTPWFVGIAAAVGLFVSVTLHELGHAWAARRYGLEVESITLWILGGLASLQSIPREWQKEFWIAVAGPAASVLVAMASYAAVLAVPASFPVVTFVLGWLVVTNLLLTAFNLLPAFPMDGGRVLRALLARSRPYPTATRIAARVGSGFAIAFAVVGVLSFSPLLLLLALFVYGGANSESRLVALDALLEGVTVDDVMATEFGTVSPDAPIRDLVDRMMAERRTAFLVTDESGVVGVVSIDDLGGARGREADTVREITDEGVPRVPSGTALFEAIASMNGARTDAAIVEANGDVAGLITAADLSTALQVRRRAGAVQPRTAM